MSLTAVYVAPSIKQAIEMTLSDVRAREYSKSLLAVNSLDRQDERSIYDFMEVVRITGRSMSLILDETLLPPLNNSLRSRAGALVSLGTISAAVPLHDAVMIQHGGSVSPFSQEVDDFIVLPSIQRAPSHYDENSLTENCRVLTQRMVKHLRPSTRQERMNLRMGAVMARVSDIESWGLEPSAKFLVTQPTTLLEKESVVYDDNAERVIVQHESNDLAYSMNTSRWKAVFEEG